MMNVRFLNLPDNKSMITRYEKLRSDVVKQENVITSSLPGLTMFIRQGMFSWMQTLASEKKEMLEQTDCTNGSSETDKDLVDLLPINPQKELVIILANMVMNANQEVFVR